MNKPFSEACEINKEPILQVLKQYFEKPGQVLEIGAGTGQHAIHFAANLAHLNWCSSDRAENLPGIQLWFNEVELTNLKTPVEIDVCHHQWSDDPVDYVYSANTVHIMSWAQVECLFEFLASAMKPAAIFVLYGPFSYNGKHVSESNIRFDQWLKARDPLSGVRDVEALEKLAAVHHMQLLADVEMPINNRSLIWQKQNEIE